VVQRFAHLLQQIVETIDKYAYRAMLNVTGGGAVETHRM
jgi:hypothetical protein